MQKLTYRKFLKHRTIQLMTDLLKTLVEPDQVSQITPEMVMAQLGRRTYYRDQMTGVIKLGLCYKQIRKEIKKNPYVTLQQIKEKNKLA